MRLDRVHALADGQFGLVTRRDLRACDLSDKQIEHLVSTKAILRVHRAVYRLPGTQPSTEQDALGACLAVGSDVFTSHRTAARVWKVVNGSGDVPDVIVPRRTRPRLKTIAVHRPRNLRPDEVTRIGIIPVTRVARTLSDLATQLRADDLEEALDEALRRRIVTPAQLARYPRLRKLAEDRMKYGIPRNTLERKAIAALRAARLPEPVRQYEVNIRGKTYYPDLSYPDRLIAIELEGEAPHWGRSRWQYDHERDRALELAGWRVLPYTWQDTTERSYHFVMQIGEILGLRPIRWTSAGR